MSHLSFWTRIGCLLFTCLFALSAAESRLNAVNTTVSLHADHQVLAPNSEVLVLLQWETEPKWHLYWTNPGDSGLTPQVEWQLPEGSVIIPESQPTPQRYVVEGISTNILPQRSGFVYRLRLPATLPNELTVSASLSWLACADVCLPGTGTIARTFATAPEGVVDEAGAKLVAAARAQQPLRSMQKWQVELVQGDGVTLQLRGPQDAQIGDLDFFPHSDDILMPGISVQSQKIAPGLWHLQLKTLNNIDLERGGLGLTGVITNSAGWNDQKARGWRVQLFPSS